MISRKLCAYTVTALLSFCSLVQADNVFVGAAVGSALGGTFGHSGSGAFAGALLASSSSSTKQAGNKKQVKIVNNSGYKAWIGIHRDKCNHYLGWRVHDTIIEKNGSFTLLLSDGVDCSVVEVGGVISPVPGDYSKNITLKRWKGPSGDIRLQIVDEGNNNYSIKEV